MTAHAPATPPIDLRVTDAQIRSVTEAGAAVAMNQYRLNLQNLAAAKGLGLIADVREVVGEGLAR